ncbi:MAG: hypothetical protein ACLSVD_07190 [Eggerthellaceae bacterium]
MAESTADYLKAKGYRVSIAHRDLSLAEGATPRRAPAPLQAGRGDHGCPSVSHDPRLRRRSPLLRESQPVVRATSACASSSSAAAPARRVIRTLCPWD